MLSQGREKNQIAFLKPIAKKTVLIMEKIKSPEMLRG